MVAVPGKSFTVPAIPKVIVETLATRLSVVSYTNNGVNKCSLIASMLQAWPETVEEIDPLKLKNATILRYWSYKVSRGTTYKTIDLPSVPGKITCARTRTHTHTRAPPHVRYGSISSRTSTVHTAST
jgi:hypothetical protein